MAHPPPPELALPRCPHCNIAVPRLGLAWTYVTPDQMLKAGVYTCASCHMPILAVWRTSPTPMQVHPATRQVSAELPERAADYLQQAMDSIGTAPSGAVMLAASAVDAMLAGQGAQGGHSLRQD